jgi:ferric iron reductase protein FhuF
VNDPRSAGKRADPATGGLVETLARIARLGDDYELPISPVGEGWLSAAELIWDGPTFERVIERLCAGRGDPAARRAIGSQFVLLYLRFVWPVVAAFALERRVPDVAAENLLVRLDDAGWPSTFALAQPRFAALESDPAAGEATELARDEADLARWLHERSIEVNAAPLVETVRKRLLTSGTALWGNVAAAFAHPLLWHVQHVAAESAAVVRDAEALLAGPEAPKLGDQVRLLRVVQGDEEWTVHTRRTCCLRWCLPGESRCDDCPLVREPEASEFLRARLAEAIVRGEALRHELGLGSRERKPGRDRRPA